MDGLRIPNRLAQEIMEQARHEAPNECCGVLAGSDGEVTRIYPATNIDQSPVKYTIAPNELPDIFRQADEAGQDILGFYHSHTFSEAYPSVTDIKLAPPSDLFDYQYMIVSLAEKETPAIRSFRISNKQVEELQVEVTD